jgi:hypothetical protein
MGASAALPMFWQFRPPSSNNTCRRHCPDQFLRQHRVVFRALSDRLDARHHPERQPGPVCAGLLIALGGFLVLRTQAAIVNPR